MNLFYRLSKIRVRLVVGFAAAFLGMAVFGAISYVYFLGMETRLVFLSRADGMVNMALEARRYEKNYLLYRQSGDYTQAIDYLSRFEDMLAADRRHLVKSLGGEPLDRLRHLAGEYRKQLALAHEHLAKAKNGEGLEAAVAGLRSSGKELIERLERLAGHERSEVTEQVRDYRPLLVVFLALLAGLGAVLAHSLVSRLVRPLSTIEKATEVVAAGDYQTIPWGTSQDEIASLVHAFNRMVGQLKHNNEQMIQTEKLTALGTLTSGVAHELNNPLNNISTSCQILQEEVGKELSGEHQELLEAIEQQVDKAKDTVSSLLEFARQHEFQLKPEYLRTVVDRSLKLLRGERPQGVDVHILVPPDIKLPLDKAHMVQAVLNLVMNAFQAMGERGTLTITARRLVQSNRAELVVEDTGPGIPEDILPRIFDPFFTTKEVGRGTGLGLSIVYGVIERHRGHIEAESLPGRGTRFVITMPLGGEGS